MPKTPGNLESSTLADREREICLRFRQIRLDGGIKQDAFASQLEIPVARLKSYEIGRAPIRYFLADLACKQFNVNQRWLASGQPPKDPYFRVAAELNAAIPPKSPFSLAYDKVLSYFVIELWATIAEAAGINDQSILNEGLDPKILTPLGMLEENRGRHAVELLRRQISAVSIFYPPNAMKELESGIQELIKRINEEHRDAIEQHSQSRKDREANLRLNYKKLVSSLMQREKPVNFSFFDEKRILTYVNHREYEAGRNEVSSLVPMHNLEISDRIKAARETLGLSQSEAADKWKLRLQTLQQWEHGRREPRGLYRERIEKILAEIEGKPAGKKN